MESGAALLSHRPRRIRGAGFGFTPEQLARWRKKVAADKTGKEIAALIAAARKAGMTLDAQDVLARPPRGIDPGHPRVELLRHKGCVLGFPSIPRGLIHKPAFAGWLVQQATRAAPVVRWVHKHVA
jgi:uncharacterized protein (DUF2461 family)